MASGEDSLQDIFGPSVADDVPAESAIAPDAPVTSTQEFDDIFASGDSRTASAAAQLPAQLASAADDGKGADGDLGLDGSAPNGGGAVTASAYADELDNIFGDSPKGANGPPVGEAQAANPAGGKDETNAPATVEDRRAEAGKAGGEAIVASAGGVRSSGDQEFLDFLYDQGGNSGESTTLSLSDSDKAESAPPPESAASMQQVLPPARADLGRRSGVPPFAQGEENGSASAHTTGINSGDGHGPSSMSPTATLDSIPLGSPPQGTEKTVVTGTPNATSPGAAAEPVGAPRERFVRKERAKPMRPLPDDPESALREMALSGGSDAGNVATAGKGDAADAGDVGYVRRLCAAAGGFLTPELRPAVWRLLLGLGRETEDAGFMAWREARRKDATPSALAAPISFKIDLRNDCLALARKLCESAEGFDGAGEDPEDEAGKDPEAVAVEMEEVLTFYCTRRSEAYEPVLCALVGPLFAMGMDASAVSSLLYPLVSSLTMFLGRGLTLAVRDLAWAHAHRRLHDLCTYHDPELVQHLDRCFPGWEMPLPAASVSRAETSALDQEAAAMVDDLESSLAASLPRRRSAGKGGSMNLSAAIDEEAGAAGGKPGRQGMVEPSLLVAASAGLGASARLKSLLPLWDYLLVRQDKHFGFFLLLASLLSRREELLAASGPQLRLVLADALSPAAMAPRLEACGGGGSEEGTADMSTLVAWCAEAEALDLATPESFRHHLALIGEIAEAEHQAAVRAPAVREGQGRGEARGPSSTASAENTPGSSAAAAAAAQGGEAQRPAAVPAAAASSPADEGDNDHAAGKGLSHPSLQRMRSLMKNAGDKLAADLKNLKLARASSTSEASTHEPAPPSELSLPQLCLVVSAKELVSRVSRSDRRRPDGGNGEGDGDTGLFRKRPPLSFFVVDCRPKQQVDAGRFPTAFHLDPSAMDNPEDIAETILPVFEPLKGRAHVCLVGSGDGHLRARGFGLQNGSQATAERGDADGVGSMKAARNEYSYVNTCAIFFMKRGFPYVSVLEGGFAAAHELVMDATDPNGSQEMAESTPLSGAIVDHNRAACRLCLAQSAASASASQGGGMVGLLFPPSPPLWARMGAADTSAHGEALPAGDTPPPSKADDVPTPFFPAPQALFGGNAKTSPPPPPEDGVLDARGRSESSGNGGDGAGAAANFFKPGGMFRGMNMNMNMNVFKGAGTAPAQAGGEGGQEAPGTSTTAEPSGVADPKKSDGATDIASKLRLSFGRFGAKDIAKNGRTGGDGELVEELGAPPSQPGDDRERRKSDSSFGSLLRKAQSLKAADVAAAFADLRDGPKTLSVAPPSDTPVVFGAGAGSAEEGVMVVEDDDGDNVGGVFVIGDDASEASEASETPDSDFEGFDGEHKPPSAGGARSIADKEVALLEHRLSGQVKGATMVVDDFLKVPGAKLFSITKHKVTFHDVEPTPSEEGASLPEIPPGDGGGESEEPASIGSEAQEGDHPAAAAAATSGTAANEQVQAADTPEVSAESSEEAVRDEPSSPPTTRSTATNVSKKIRVRAVTELERVMFLSRERVLVLACPGGPRSPGLVKSNHHLTELQKMTFMRKDPSLVTLHYFAGAQEGAGPALKKNMYRFDLDDKETFIRIIRGALQRFQL